MSNQLIHGHPLVSSSQTQWKKKLKKKVDHHNINLAEKGVKPSDLITKTPKYITKAKKILSFKQGSERHANPRCFADGIFKNSWYHLDSFDYKLSNKKKIAWKSVNWFKSYEDLKMTVLDNLNSASNELKFLTSPQKIVDHGASCSDPPWVQWLWKLLKSNAY